MGKELGLGVSGGTRQSEILEFNDDALLLDDRASSIAITTLGDTYV